MPKPIEIEKMVWPSECAEMLGVGVAMITEAKKEMGIERKKVFPSEIQKFFKTHRNFKSGEGKTVAEKING